MDANEITRPRKVIGLRQMTPGEIEENAWYEKPEETVVVLLEGGWRLVVDRDPEGNGAGAFVHRRRGEDHHVFADYAGLDGLTFVGFGDGTKVAQRKGWPLRNAHVPVPALALFDDRSFLVPMADPEGNEPGVLFLVDPDDNFWGV